MTHLEALPRSRSRRLINRLILSSGLTSRPRLLLLSLVLFPAPTVLCQSSNPASPVQPGFSDVTSALGVHFQHVASHTSKKYLIETMGSGVALFDYDNDGRLDIFFVNGAPLGDPTPKGTIAQHTGPKD